MITKVTVHSSYLYANRWVKDYSKFVRFHRDKYSITVYYDLLKLYQFMTV